MTAGLEMEQAVFYSCWGPHGGFHENYQTATWISQRSCMIVTAQSTCSLL